MVILLVQDKKIEDEVPSWSHNFALKYCIAFAAAACAETVTYPLDVTKTRMQIAGELRKVSVDALKERQGMLKTGLGIIQNEGVLGLWRGLSPALYRHVIYSGIRMALYEKLRDDIFGKDPDGSYPIYKAALTGLLVGGIAQLSANPMDLVKVQLQMEGRRSLEGKPPRVKGVFEALFRIWKEAGIRGLWRGWAPNVQRGALVNLGDLTTYDSAKRFLLQNTSVKDGTGLHVLSSLMAGFVASLMGTPADVVKTRVMNQPTENGKGIYYKNSMDCLRKTISNEGFFALYKGFLPIWMRLGPWSLTFWVSFEWFRSAVGVSSF